MDLTNVEFVWASDLVKNPDYWKLVLQVGKSNALKRFVRTAEMMGREESLEKLTGAHIIYSCMQVADIFMLGAKITQLGMDQRKVNMLAREVGPQLSPPAGGWKPVVVSHHMLMGLTPPGKSEIQNSKFKTNSNDSNSNLENSNIVSEFDIRDSNLYESKLSRTIAIKMSKSNPDSAIFMTDTKQDIKRKMTKAWAPEGVVKENPILEYCKYIIFESFDELRISRPDKFGGTIIYKSYTQLEQDYASKALHPMDLKSSVIEIIDSLLQPVRNHFEQNEEAKKLLEQVKTYQVTR